jgi:hypothetical protein
MAKRHPGYSSFLHPSRCKSTCDTNISFVAIFRILVPDMAPGKGMAFFKAKKDRATVTQADVNRAELTGIKQGAAAAVGKAFGSTGKKKKEKRHKDVDCVGDLRCWDAFDPLHLPLPRAVAPYTTIRTTAIWNPSDENNRTFALFAPSLDVSADAGQWSTSYALSSNKLMTDALSITDGVTQHVFEGMSSTSWKAASVVPSAFSVQIMNPEAMATTEGMVYIGRCLNKVNLSEGTLSKNFQSVVDNLVSYSAPRLCSAGKLALRGVQVDSIPNNMSQLANFTTLKDTTTKTFTLDQTNVSHMEGFNPIFIYNPNQVALQVLVCCEWRVRFDPSNPAYAACRMHAPSTDHTWYETLRKGADMGAAVVDIAEKAVQLGRAIR